VRIPAPPEIGLPEKFTAWRPSQEDALRWLATSPKRVKALCAPTGFGKTAVYVADALLSREPTCIVTDNRGLQDQLMGDFASIGLVDIRGRNNYTCDLQPGYSCEDGYAARCPYRGTAACPSSLAEMRAAASPLVVTNYDKWTSARKFGQGMQHFQRVVFDEGHKAPEAVARAMQVVLGAREIEETLGLDFPAATQTSEIVNWKPWANEARAEAEAMLGPAREALSDPDVKQTWIKHFLHLRNLTRKLSTIATCRSENWVVDEIKTGYQFDPVRVGKYAEAALLLGIPKILIVSATVRPKTLFQLGIAQSEFDYKEFASEFDPARCPIYYVPTMRVDKNHPDQSMLWVRLDQIAGRRRDRKGIVHTISYTRRDAVLGASRFAGDMIVNEQGEASTETVAFYKRAKREGTILVSPSVAEGFDFPGADCEWQFVCKIPFPDGRSKIVKARQEDDKEYGAYYAINKLVQTFGRGMRSKTDQCENFIGDDNLEWFLKRFGHLAPKSFYSFFRHVTTLPQPPTRL
jgi:Rad3-related DNA helicase